MFGNSWRRWAGPNLARDGPMGQRRQGIISLMGEMGRWDSDWCWWESKRGSQGAPGQPALAASRATALSRSC